tara:strand:- start:56 stop:547 length:492 start_codon:yes stop_codon:yes gene_type:complete
MKTYHRPHLLTRLVQEIKNIPDRIPHDIKKKGGFYIDFYLNKCLETVDRINELNNITTRQKLKARKDIFEVYFKLQDFKGPEVQDHKRDRLIYVGGLGYASVAKAVLTEKMGRAVNHYWKPPKKKPPSLVDFDLSLVYNPKPTMQDWRNSMAKQKIEVLRGTM